MVGVNDHRDPYLRVVAAELFSEALTRIDDDAEALATSQALELQSRATYAAGEGFAA